MSTQVQRRRGTAAENAAFTGAPGEIVVETDTKRIGLHDGATLGGMLIPNCVDEVKNYFKYATATGTDTIAATLPFSPGSYVAGMKLTFLPANTITGAATINVNGLGAKSLKKLDATGTLVDVIAGDVLAGVPTDITYNGTHFIVDIKKAVGGAWIQVDQKTATGVTSNNFTSIPQTYTDLMLIATGISSNTATRSPVCQFSASGGASISGIYLDVSSGGTLTGGVSTSNPSAFNASTTQTAAETSIYSLIILNYTKQMCMAFGSHAIVGGGTTGRMNIILTSSGTPGIDTISNGWNSSGNYDGSPVLTLYAR